MTFSLRLSCAAVVAAIALYAGLAQADYQVMESTITALPQGTTLPENAELDIPEGERVKLLRTPAGSTHELEGPYQGTVEDYEATAKCPWWKKISVGCEDESAPIGIRSTPSPER